MHEIKLDDVTKLINFISSNENNFVPVTQRTPYYHMGATITDSILQAGLNYRHVVYPRVAKLLTQFSDYRTTCDFIILMQTIPLREIIEWKNEQKLSRIMQLSWFFFDKQVETEDHLAEWLKNEYNIRELSEINGVGPKTIDYLKMLSGRPEIAIDRHLFKFLELAGIFVKTYNQAYELYCCVAQRLNIDKYELDKKIWTYMSSSKA